MSAGLMNGFNALKYIHHPENQLPNSRSRLIKILHGIIISVNIITAGIVTG